MTTAPALLADAIERGRALHPEWRQAWAALYRTRSGWVQGERPTKATASACALGFALVGKAELGTAIPCPVCDTTSGLSHLNDTHRWSLDQIVRYLREIA